MNGSTRLEASFTRRITTAHAPPDRWPTIMRASDPSETPTQNTYASRYDLKNCSRPAAKPTAHEREPGDTHTDGKALHAGEAGRSGVTGDVVHVDCRLR